MDIINFIVFFVELYVVSTSSVHEASAYKDVSSPEDSQIVQAEITNRICFKMSTFNKRSVLH